MCILHHWLHNIKRNFQNDPHFSSNSQNVLNAPIWMSKNQRESLPSHLDYIMWFGMRIKRSHDISEVWKSVHVCFFFLRNRHCWKFNILSHMPLSFLIINNLKIRVFTFLLQKYICSFLEWLYSLYLGMTDLCLLSHATFLLMKFVNHYLWTYIIYHSYIAFLIWWITIKYNKLLNM